MKKLLLLMPVLATTFVWAQDTKIGIKAGVNFSNYYIDDVSDQDIKTSFHAGIFMKAPLTERVSIQPEVLFSQKGSTLYYDNFFGEGILDLTVNYIDVPVQLRVDLIPGLYITAGPYVSFMINSTVVDKDPDGDINFEEELDKSDFNTFDWGLCGGAGFDIGAFTIGARYNYGFVTVGKEQENAFGQRYRYPDGKNSVTQVFVGFGF